MMQLEAAKAQAQKNLSMAQLDEMLAKIDLQEMSEYKKTMMKNQIHLQKKQLVTKDKQTALSSLLEDSTWGAQNGSSQ